MGLNKTEFIQGLNLSYPIESLPKLFGTLGAVSKRGFFEKMAELDKPDGGGMPLEKIIEIIRIGLIAEKPLVSFDEAQKLVSEYNNEYGYEGLEIIIIDALADAKLLDKKEVAQRRELLKELKAISLKKLELDVHSKQADLEEAEKKILEKVADMGEANPETLKTTPQT